MLVGFAMSKKIIGGFVSSKIFCVSIRIISEVLKMNLVESGGTNVWFVPPDSEAGGTCPPCLLPWFRRQWLLHTVISLELTYSAGT